jgi:hypothetical protein
VEGGGSRTIVQQDRHIEDCQKRCERNEDRQRFPVPQQQTNCSRGNDDQIARCENAIKQGASRVRDRHAITDGRFLRVAQSSSETTARAIRNSAVEMMAATSSIFCIPLYSVARLSVMLHWVKRTEEQVGAVHAPAAEANTDSNSASSSRPIANTSGSSNWPNSEDGRSYSKTTFPRSSSKSTTRNGA